MLSNFFNPQPRKRFWKWFADHTDSLAAVTSGEERILRKLDRELRRVHPQLTFEMGLGVDPLEFIVSANGIRSVFPAVEQLVAEAPVISHWKIIAFRQPKGSVLEVRYGNFLLKEEDVWFSHKPRMDKTDLTIYIRDLSPHNREQAMAASFLLLDNALGEYLVATGIGFIDHQPLPESPAARGFQPLSEIRSVVVKK